MKMSEFTPNDLAIRPVFFSIRILVAPHPDSSAAYSARKVADSRNMVLFALFISQRVIFLVHVSRQIEDIFVFAYFEKMSGLAVSIAPY